MGVRKYLPMLIFRQFFYAYDGKLLCGLPASEDEACIALSRTGAVYSERYAKEFVSAGSRLTGLYSSALKLFYLRLSLR
jgi:hypothetical protein